MATNHVLLTELDTSVFLNSRTNKLIKEVELGEEKGTNSHPKKPYANTFDCMLKIDFLSLYYILLTTRWHCFLFLYSQLEQSTVLSCFTVVSKEKMNK